MSDPTPHTTIEYGWRIDCEANGCPIPHADAGEVIPALGSRSMKRLNRDGLPTNNGHVVAPVRRTVTRSPWVGDEPPAPTPLIGETSTTP